MTKLAVGDTLKMQIHHSRTGWEGNYWNLMQLGDFLYVSKKDMNFLNS